jgi:prevent-host-death family protein
MRPFAPCCEHNRQYAGGHDLAHRLSSGVGGSFILMCDSYMSEVAVSEARNRLAEVIEASRRSGEPISVTRRGRRVAVIIDSDAFDRLVEIADDVDDRRELDAARADDDYVPWADVKAMLGLD